MSKLFLLVLSGIVTDQQGALVRGARVEVRNSGTNATFLATTGDQGYYSTPALPVGRSTAMRSKEGSSTFRNAVLPMIGASSR